MAVDISQYVAQFGRNTGAPISAGVSRGLQRGDRNRMAQAQDQQAQEEYMTRGIKVIQSLPPEQRPQGWQSLMQGASEQGWDISGDEQWSDDMLPRLQARFGVAPPETEEQQQGPRFGTINPRDYTSDSLAQYQQSGDFRDLQRYESQRSVDIGGVPHRFDPASGGWYPAEVNPGGGAPGVAPQPGTGGRPRQITAEDVAASEAERAGAVTKAKEEARREVERQNPQAMQIKNTSLQLVNQLLGYGPEGERDPEALEATKGIFGRFDASAVGQMTQSGRQIDQQAALNQLRDILTAENLGIMSGVLTDRDIQVIANIAGGGLTGRQTDERAVEQLEELRGRLAKQVEARESSGGQQQNQQPRRFRYNPQTGRLE